MVAVKEIEDLLALSYQCLLTDKFELNAATRYDKYDDASSNVGARKSNMFSFAYRPNDDVLDQRVSITII